MHDNTRLIRSHVPLTKYGEHSSPLYLNSSFSFPDAESMQAAFEEGSEATVYSRYSNPNTDELIDRLCILENAEDGWVMASGMAAIFTCFSALLNQGDHILACRSVFGSTHQIFSNIFPKWGISHSYFDVKASEDEWETLLDKNTKILFVESPTNPALELLDLENLAKFAQKHNLIFVVDNCFATPILQKPLNLGADLVIHSMTKFIDGQGRVLGGVVLGKKELIKEIGAFARHSGPALSPFHAWLLSNSLETFELRVREKSRNAKWIAQQLENHPAIVQLTYPHLESHPQYDLALKQMKHGGALFCFELKGGQKAGAQFLNKLSICSLTTNLGDCKSIASHPASTTHSKLSEEERLAVGITPGLIRISAGLEHPEDILNDILNALE